MSLIVDPLWSHPAHVSPVVLTLLGHTADINSIVLLPDDRRLVSAAEDGTVRVWDIRMGRELAQLEGHTAGSVNTIALAPDGACFATGSDDGTVRLWDARTLAPIRTLEGGSKPMRKVAAGARVIVAASDDKMVYVWERATGNRTFVLPGHEHYLNGVALTPDERQALAFSIDHDIRIWDLATGETVGRLYGDKAPVAVAGRFYLGGNNLTGKGHVRVPQVAKFVGDGGLLTAARELIVWRFDGREELARFEHAWPIESLDCRGDLVVTGSHDVQFFSLRERRRVGRQRGVERSVRALALDATGRSLVVGGNGGILEVRAVDLASQHAHISNVRELRISVPAGTVASGDSEATTRLWRADTGAHVATLEADPSPGSRPFVFSDDGARLVTTGDEAPPRLWVWDARTGAPLAVVAGAEDAAGGNFYSVTVLPDGKSALAAPAHAPFAIWDLEGRRPPAPLDGKTQQVSTILLSADRTRVVTKAYFSLHGENEFRDSTDHLQVWDLAGRRQLWSQAADVKPRDESRDTVRFGEPAVCGQHIVCGDGHDGRLCIWSLESGERLAVLPISCDPYDAAAIDDRRAIVVAALEGPEPYGQKPLILATVDVVARTASVRSFDAIFSCYALAGDGLLFAGSDGDTIDLVRTTDRSPPTRYRCSETIHAIAIAAVAPGEHLVLVAVGEGRLEALRVRSA
ncbi:MAG TPA: WD40 repeat domain-containing protein [Polyangia bacterium]|jgi:WD40 repeat protein|nr:WD40 repeat domain-containing protein [Polyangia bacterium]